MIRNRKKTIYFNIYIYFLFVSIAWRITCDMIPDRFVKFLTQAHSKTFYTSQKNDTFFSNHILLTVRTTVFKLSITLYFYSYFVFLVLYNYIFTFHQNSITLFLPTNRFDSAMRPCKRQGGVYSTYAWIYTQIRKIKC